MDDNEGNDGESGTSGNPYISGSLCAAYRETLRSEMNSFRDNISFTIKITGAAITIILAIVQFYLYYFGGL